MTDKDNIQIPVTDFINGIRITEVKDRDYIIHLYNSFSKKVFIFKVCKDLFDKAMEIRNIDELNIRTQEEVTSEIKKGKKVKIDGGLYA